MNAPERACLIIADISGYTSYLAGVELDHAQDILADLMGVMVDGLRPPFTLAKLEGDAIFVFGPSEGLDGSALQDAIETTYFSFRRRLRNIHRATTCECNACVLIPTLDLKFVAHSGLAAKQSVADREELMGRDVILVHRLLKNNVAEKLAHRPYVLYTDACVKQLGIPAEAHGLIPHVEQIDVIGEVRVWLRDLDAAWQEAEAANRDEVSVESAFATMTFDLDAPRSVVWDFLTSPVKRPLWVNGVSEVREQTKDTRRRGRGTTNHCMHGANVQIEEILSWHANESVTSRSILPDPIVPPIVVTNVPTDLPGDRTRFEIRLGQPEPEYLEATQAAIGFLKAGITAGATALGKLVAAEAERLRSLQADEPAIPKSAGRFASEPIVGNDHSGHDHSAHHGHSH